MVPWLVPIAVFWPLAAMYLGGAPIALEGGGGVRQTGGLFLHFAMYLVTYALIGVALSGLMGPILGGIVVPVVLASVLLPVLAKVAFRVVGVRITSTSDLVAE